MPRPKGVRNKRTLAVEEMAAKLKCEPFEILCYFAMGNYEALGYEAKTRTCFTAAGIEFEEDIIKPEQRLTAAKEASKYLYSQKKALEVANKEGESFGIEVIVKDYTKK